MGLKENFSQAVRELTGGAKGDDKKNNAQVSGLKRALGEDNDYRSQNDPEGQRFIEGASQPYYRPKAEEAQGRPAEQPYYRNEPQQGDRGYDNRGYNPDTREYNNQDDYNNDYARDRNAGRNSEYDNARGGDYSDRDRNQGYDRNAEYDRNAGYDHNADYDRNAGYDRDRNDGYDRSGGYDRNGGYDRDRNAGYDRSGGYDRDRNGGYDRNAGYDRDRNSGYDRSGGYDRDRNSGYDRNGGYDRSGGYGSRARDTYPMAGRRREKEPVDDNPDNELTIISANTIVDGNVRSFANMSIDGDIKGDVETTKDIELNGRVVGNVTCNNANMIVSQVQGNVLLKGNVEIGRDTLLIGDLTSGFASINGKVKGNVEISGKAEFKADAVIFGDISASTITVDDGAIIQGYVSTTFLNKEESANIFPEAVSIRE